MDQETVLRDYPGLRCLGMDLPGVAERGSCATSLHQTTDLPERTHENGSGNISSTDVSFDGCPSDTGPATDNALRTTYETVTQLKDCRSTSNFTQKENVTKRSRNFVKGAHNLQDARSEKHFSKTAKSESIINIAGDKVGLASSAVHQKARKRRAWTNANTNVDTKPGIASRETYLTDADHTYGDEKATNVWSVAGTDEKDSAAHGGTVDLVGNKRTTSVTKFSENYVQQEEIRLDMNPIGSVTPTTGEGGQWFKNFSSENSNRMGATLNSTSVSHVPSTQADTRLNGSLVSQAMPPARNDTSSEVCPDVLSTRMGSEPDNSLINPAMFSTRTDTKFSSSLLSPADLSTRTDAKLNSNPVCPTETSARMSGGISRTNLNEAYSVLTHSNRDLSKANWDEANIVATHKKCRGRLNRNRNASGAAEGDFFGKFCVPICCSAAAWERLCLSLFLISAVAGYCSLGAGVLETLEATEPRESMDDIHSKICQEIRKLLPAVLAARRIVTTTPSTTTPVTSPPTTSTTTTSTTTTTTVNTTTQSLAQPGGNASQPLGPLTNLTQSNGTQVQPIPIEVIDLAETGTQEQTQTQAAAAIGEGKNSTDIQDIVHDNKDVDVGHELGETTTTTEATTTTTATTASKATTSKAMTIKLAVRQIQTKLETDESILGNSTNCSGAADRILTAYKGNIEKFSRDKRRDENGVNKWNYMGSLFFTISLVTSIGYGTLAPVTEGGRGAAVLYGLIGIPLMFYCVLSVGNYIIRMLRVVFAKLQGGDNRVPVWAGILLVFLYIIVGSITFSIWEKWTYLEAMYFCFFTLTTVGFGDFVPGYSSGNLEEDYEERKFHAIVYILIGLALMSAALTLIARWFFALVKRTLGVEDTNKNTNISTIYEETVKLVFRSKPLPTIDVFVGDKNESRMTKGTLSSKYTGMTDLSPEELISFSRRRHGVPYMAGLTAVLQAARYLGRPQAVNTTTGHSDSSVAEQAHYFTPRIPKRLSHIQFARYLQSARYSTRQQVIKASSGHRDNLVGQSHLFDEHSQDNNAFGPRASFSCPLSPRTLLTHSSGMALAESRVPHLNGVGFEAVGDATRECRLHGGSSDAAGNTRDYNLCMGEHHLSEAEWLNSRACHYSVKSCLSNGQSDPEPQLRGGCSDAETIAHRALHPVLEAHLGGGGHKTEWVNSVPPHLGLEAADSRLPNDTHAFEIELKNLDARQPKCMHTCEKAPQNTYLSQDLKAGSELPQNMNVIGKEHQGFMANTRPLQLNTDRRTPPHSEPKDLNAVLRPTHESVLGLHSSTRTLPHSDPNLKLPRDVYSKTEAPHDSDSISRLHKTFNANARARQNSNTISRPHRPLNAKLRARRNLNAISRPPQNVNTNAAKGKPGENGKTDDGGKQKGKLTDFDRSCNEFMLTANWLVIVLAYCLCGAWMFQQLETPKESNEWKNLSTIQGDTLTMFKDLLSIPDQGEKKEQAEFVEKTDSLLFQYRDEVYSLLKNRSYDQQGESKWTYSGTLLFIVTIITTVGFGNIAPATDEGRIFCMFFALLGIPLTMLCLMQCSHTMLVFVRHTYRRCCDAPDLTLEEMITVPVWRLIMSIYWCFFFIGLYFLMGAYIFNQWEGWSYTDAVYFCVTTLLTIGYGDFVPGFGEDAVGEIDWGLERLDKYKPDININIKVDVKSNTTNVTGWSDYVPDYESLDSRVKKQVVCTVYLFVGIAFLLMNFRLILAYFHGVMYGLTGLTMDQRPSTITITKAPENVEAKKEVSSSSSSEGFRGLLGGTERAPDTVISVTSAPGQVSEGRRGSKGHTVMVAPLMGKKGDKYLKAREKELLEKVAALQGQLTEMDALQLQLAELQARLQQSEWTDWWYQYETAPFLLRSYLGFSRGTEV